MTYTLTRREVSALEKIEFETSYLRGDFTVARTLAPGVGEVTLKRLLDLGLIEYGLSGHFHGEYGYRTTEDGERCLFGLTVKEIMALPEGHKHHAPRVKKWPLD